MEENKEIEIDLKKIFLMLKKKAIYIVLIALIGAAVSGCITNFCITPQYTAGIKMYVNSNNDNLLGSNGSISSGEIEASQKLVNTYLVVVESKTFLEKVSDKLGGEITPGEIKQMINCSPIDETLAFQVKVTSSNAQLAAQIANVIADTCPEEIIRVLKVGGVEVIDYASVPTKQSSPNLERNIFIGFLASFVLSFLFFFIKEMFDTRIMSEKDLEKDFNIPVLGTIPRLLPVQDSTAVENKNDQNNLLNSIMNSNKKEEK